jgi:hypothetical protein
MNAGVQNLVISLAAMQLARKVPFDDPTVLLYVRIGYVVAQVVILGAYYYAVSVVKKKNDQTILKYVEPQSPMTQDPPNLVTIVVRDYDLQEISKLIRSAFIGIAMMGLLHGYLGYTQPLFVQSLMGLKNLYDAKPVAIHILGQSATGDLARPFKTAGLFGAAANPQTDAAAIAAAEKQASSSKKNE